MVGREQLVAEVSAALRRPGQGGSPVVFLTGPGGVGKSTVALTVAHSAGDLFPGGRLYADLRGTQAGPVDPHDVAGWWLHALGVGGAELPDDPDERIAALRSQAGDRRLLLVLDDAATEEQVRPLLVGAPGSATVITSRRHLGALVGVARWAVPMLSPDDSRRLLAEIAGADRVVREPAAAAAIAERCGHLPLALCVVAARLSVRPEWTLADIERRLAEQSGRLDVLAVGDLNVRATIGLSYHTLGPAARRLLRRLGLIDFPDWPAWLAGELTGAATAAEVDRTVDELVDSHLVVPLGRDPVGQARFRLHALVADFARERADVEDDEPTRSAALARSLRGWLALAAEADQRLGQAPPVGTGGPQPAGARSRPAHRSRPADRSRPVIRSRPADRGRRTGRRHRGTRPPAGWRWSGPTWSTRCCWPAAPATASWPARSRCGWSASSAPARMTTTWSGCSTRRWWRPGRPVPTTSCCSCSPRCSCCSRSAVGTRSCRRSPRRSWPSPGSWTTSRARCWRSTTLAGRPG